MDVYISSGPWSTRSPWKWFYDPSLFAGIVSKTYTRFPNEGNPIWKSVDHIKGGGWTNRMGLPNRGMKEAVALYHEMSIKQQDKFVPSIALAPHESPDTIIKILNFFHISMPVVRQIEINVSCPSVSLDHKIAYPMLKMYMSASPTTNLVLKVGYQTEISTIKDAVSLGYKIHASNSLRLVDPHNRYWGLSGNTEVFIANRDRIERIRKEVPNAYIIAGGGITDIDAARYYIDILQVNAISIGSVLLSKPWMANRIAKALSCVHT